MFESHNIEEKISLSIKDVKCAETYTIALSESGEVYTWGRGSQGKLGNESENSEVHPYKVRFNFDHDSQKIHKAKF